MNIFSCLTLSFHTSKNSYRYPRPWQHTRLYLKYNLVVLPDQMDKVVFRPLWLVVQHRGKNFFICKAVSYHSRHTITWVELFLLLTWDDWFNESSVATMFTCNWNETFETITTWKTHSHDSLTQHHTSDRNARWSRVGIYRSRVFGHGRCNQATGWLHSRLLSLQEFCLSLCGYDSLGVSLNLSSVFPAFFEALDRVSSFPSIRKLDRLYRATIRRILDSDRKQNWHPWLEFAIRFLLDRITSLVLDQQLDLVKLFLHKIIEFLSCRQALLLDNSECHWLPLEIGTSYTRQGNEHILTQVDSARLDKGGDHSLDRIQGQTWNRCCRHCHVPLDQIETQQVDGSIPSTISIHCAFNLYYWKDSSCSLECMVIS